MVVDASLLTTQHYKVRIKGKLEQSREKNSAFPYTLVLQLSKREPSGHPSTTVANFTLYKHESKSTLPDGDTDYIVIVAGERQGDTLASYLFIICLDYLLRTSIDIRYNERQLTKERSGRYSAQTITDVDYTVYIVLLANTPAQAESMLHSLERAAVGIGLHVNVDKTEYMCFHQRGDISTLNGSSLKLVDNFTYRGSSVSSTVKDMNTRLAKAWIANDSLSVIWKSGLDRENKTQFFPSSGSVNTSIWMYYMDVN